MTILNICIAFLLGMVSLSFASNIQLCISNQTNYHQVWIRIDDLGPQQRVVLKQDTHQLTNNDIWALDPNIIDEKTNATLHPKANSIRISALNAKIKGRSSMLMIPNNCAVTLPGALVLESTASGNITCKASSLKTTCPNQLANNSIHT